jgi:hypothetical protein
MRSEPPSDDPRNIWQNQPTEIPRMTMEEIHQQKARQLRAKRRRDPIVLAAVLILFAIAMSAMAHGTIPRLASALAILWILIVHSPGSAGPRLEHCPAIRLRSADSSSTGGSFDTSLPDSASLG